eukprot:11153329-Alexandrium_andersonii.AAC.1
MTPPFSALVRSLRVCAVLCDFQWLLATPMHVRVRALLFARRLRGSAARPGPGRPRGPGCVASGAW